jgi:hypothetical protein
LPHQIVVTNIQGPPKSTCAFPGTKQAGQGEDADVLVENQLEECDEVSMVCTHFSRSVIDSLLAFSNSSGVST